MHIVIRQTCGLGNQLFQYAAGRYLAKRYGGSLRVAHELPYWQVQNGHPRPVLLPKFAICAPIKKVSYFDRLVLSEQPALAVAARIARASRKIQVIREAPWQFTCYQDLRIADGTRTAYICGFWQDYSIVREVETELRRELLLLEPASAGTCRSHSAFVNPRTRCRFTCAEATSRCISVSTCCYPKRITNARSATS